MKIAVVHPFVGRCDVVCLCVTELGWTPQWEGRCAAQGCTGVKETEWSLTFLEGPALSRCSEAGRDGAGERKGKLKGGRESVKEILPPPLSRIKNEVCGHHFIQYKVGNSGQDKRQEAKTYSGKETVELSFIQNSTDLHMHEDMHTERRGCKYAC